MAKQQQPLTISKMAQIVGRSTATLKVWELAGKITSTTARVMRHSHMLGAFPYQSVRGISAPA